MSDLVKRLREDFRGCPFPSVYTTCNEAADELERLQAENAKLKYHAEEMANDIERDQGYYSSMIYYRLDFPKEPDK